MKKHLLINLFIILTSNIIFGQTTKKAIIGDWIKVKAERKDGSKIIDRMGMDTAFLEYSFTERDFSSQRHPSARKEGLDYYIKKDRIYVDIIIEYKIEKITRDSLILSTVFQKEPDHKLNRYYFIKKDILSKSHPIQRKGDVAIYNKYNTPRVHKIFTTYLKDCNSESTETIRFKGSIFFDHKEKSITANLEFFDNSNRSKRDRIKSCIESTYLYWDFTEVPKYPKSKLDFVAKSYDNSNYIKFLFGTNDLSEIDNLKHINFEEIDKSEEHFSKGISDLENNQLDSAIHNFTLSYQFDKVRIDAIYKRAETFLLKGDKEKACKDWGLLINLDQALARKKHTENCK